jgi:hypothetical protein
MQKISAVLLIAISMAACAPSPLYIGRSKTTATLGTIPRDGNGEPIWSQIPPAPANQSEKPPQPK